MRLKRTRPAGPRLYTKGARAYPSVTEILKLVENRHLEAWRHRVGRMEADRVGRDAKAFGSRVHLAAQSVAWGEDVLAPEMAPYVNAIREFLDGHVLEVLGTEVELVSEKHLFGGTLDLYCQLKDGSYAVVDYKTSSALTREYGLQTAAYGLLCQEHGMTVNKRLVVRVKKEQPGAWHCRRYKDHAEDLEAFLSLRNFWWWRHKKAMAKRVA